LAEGNSIWKGIRSIFFKGLATLLPTILTIYLFLVVFNFVRYKVSDPINVFAGRQLYATEWGRNYLYDKFEVPFQGKDGTPLKGDVLTAELKAKLPWWPGFVIAFLVVMAAGFFIASWVGRRMWRGGERLLTRIPMVKVIYPYAKQVTDFVFGDKKKPSYSSVVAVEYPRPGLWAVGFVTGEGLLNIKKRVGRKMLNVFVPCSPAPMSGFTVIIPEDEVVPVNMSVDEAMRFIVSAGVIVPEQQLTEEGHTRILRLKESGRLHPAKQAQEDQKKCLPES
jgi:uncharacterized membrane protein